MGLLQKLFGTYSERELKLIKPLVEDILSREAAVHEMTQEAMQERVRELRRMVMEDGVSLDDILPETFALVREAADRALGMKPYPVQVMGGIVLHQGRIAEMKTGEGKTLVATMPSFLNALSGRGVHVVTVNDYLAARDAEWMGQVHRYLGLTVGCVLNSMNDDERREAYACDITYVTNNELGFDYLRDNMVTHKEKLVQRELHYAIIDEVDSILIDEARTPLIISGRSTKSSQIYRQADTLVRRMQRGTFREFSKMEMLEMSASGDAFQEDGDFIVNEKEKNVTLTAQGIEKVEQYFHLENLADPENTEYQHVVILALRAHYLMMAGRDYVVQDKQVFVVDEFTGRIMPGRRYSDGLHQAIEAKEGLEVKGENKTLATITFQNFFNKYEKKSGMTGTAMTEEKEFQTIYSMDVVEIPTNKPVIRIDHEDAVYKTQREKYAAVVEEIARAHEKNQPVLVGTVSIEISEMIARMVRARLRGAKVEVLNARFHDREAEIVAGAGVAGTITIATNMAGRGTDIRLDADSIAAGGLKIIGTERHESRRIDNQLRGRSGRQGDPGESQFFISLEDDLMRLFGSERMLAAFNALGVPEGQELHHKALSDAIERAQKKIESNNFSIRQHLNEYDLVNNEQREVIYGERRKVLNGENLRPSVINMITTLVENIVDSVIPEDTPPEEWNMAELNLLLKASIPIQVRLDDDKMQGLSKEKLKQGLKELAIKMYEEKETQFPAPEACRERERIFLLLTIDRKWMDHIDNMEQLRQGVGLASYAQRDPLTEYKKAAYEMFDALIANIQEETVRLLYAVPVENQVKESKVAEVTGTNRDDNTVRVPKVRTEKKLQPNDPCWCGSGLKYKFCHGSNKKRPGGDTPIAQQ
ncbi:MAG: preprotein translocase subunit SecA [Lachnospiraceae bacterium]|nr:preprotein translocase subunit SecA [Lachnospiraceae bacterium]